MILPYALARALPVFSTASLASACISSANAVTDSGASAGRWSVSGRAAGVLAGTAFDRESLAYLAADR